MSSRDDFCVWWRENFATATPQDPSLSEAKRCTWLAWSARDARIAELERALQDVLDPFHQGQISVRPEAAGSVQAAIDAGEAALLKATKP